MAHCNAMILYVARVLHLDVWMHLMDPGALQLVLLLIVWFVFNRSGQCSDPVCSESTTLGCVDAPRYVTLIVFASGSLTT